MVYVSWVQHFTVGSILCRDSCPDRISSQRLRKWPWDRPSTGLPLWLFSYRSTRYYRVKLLEFEWCRWFNYNTKPMFFKRFCLLRWRRFWYTCPIEKGPSSSYVKLCHVLACLWFYNIQVLPRSFTGNESLLLFQRIYFLPSIAALSQDSTQPALLFCLSCSLL